MTTPQLSLNSGNTNTPKIEPGENIMQPEIKAPPKPKTNDKPIAIIMLGYFLALASIAVMVVGGQFPWFTIAPATILFLVVYFRHLEATYYRKSSTS